MVTALKQVCNHAHHFPGRELLMLQFFIVLIILDLNNKRAQYYYEELVYLISIQYLFHELQISDLWFTSCPLKKSNNLPIS